MCLGCQCPCFIPSNQEWRDVSDQDSLQLFAVADMIVMPSRSICSRKKGRM